MQIYLRFPEAPQSLPELRVYVKLVDGEEETSLKTDHEYADLARGGGRRRGDSRSGLRTFVLSQYPRGGSDKNGRHGAELGFQRRDKQESNSCSAARRRADLLSGRTSARVGLWCLQGLRLAGCSAVNERSRREASRTILPAPMPRYPAAKVGNWELWLPYRSLNRSKARC